MTEISCGEQQSLEDPTDPKAKKSGRGAAKDPDKKGGEEKEPSEAMAGLFAAKGRPGEKRRRRRRARRFRALLTRGKEKGSSPWTK